MYLPALVLNTLGIWNYPSHTNIWLHFEKTLKEKDILLCEILTKDLYSNILNSIHAEEPLQRKIILNICAIIPIANLILLIIIVMRPIKKNRRFNGVIEYLKQLKINKKLQNQIYYKKTSDIQTLEEMIEINATIWRKLNNIFGDPELPRYYDH